MMRAALLLLGFAVVCCYGFWLMKKLDVFLKSGNVRGAWDKESEYVKDSVGQERPVGCQECRLL